MWKPTAEVATLGDFTLRIVAMMPQGDDAPSDLSWVWTVSHVDGFFARGVEETQAGARKAAIDCANGAIRERRQKTCGHRRLTPMMNGERSCSICGFKTREEA